MNIKIAFIGIVFTLALLDNGLMSFATGKPADSVKVIVKYKDNNNNFSSLSNKNSLKISSVTISEANLHKEIARLEANPNVEYVELDEPAYLFETQPVNDPLIIQQTPYFNSMGVYNAWNLYNPVAEVIVAVLDSGVDVDHPDLDDNLLGGFNVINPNNQPIDIYGHGTHVAGIVGAETNNNQGIASITKQVKILPVKVLEGKQGSMSHVIEGIKYAVDYGADIINLSLGTYTNMQSLQDAINYAVSKNVLVIAASGNDNNNSSVYPAAYSNVISVAAIDTITNDKASFSNFGSEVDISAPGANIISTWIDEYKSSSGTSMATPMVSSIAAMISQHAPHLHMTQVREILESTANPIESEYLLGKGIVNPSESLQYIEKKNRIAGKTAIETAIEISTKGWSELKENEISYKGTNYSGKFVILATGNAFPDSLAASPLAGYLDSPILLTKSLTDMKAKVITEINRMEANQVILLGGTSAIPEEIEAYLIDQGKTIIRVGGPSRYETALEIISIVPTLNDTAIVVTGENFPDALSASVYAGKLQYPILFVKKDSVPLNVENYINGNVAKTIIVGGEGVISKNVEVTLPNAYRIDGENRYDTSGNLAKYFKFQTDKVLISRGDNYPDALTGSAFGIKTGSPVLLVEPSKVREETKSALSAMKGYGLLSYYILGGSQAIKTPTAWDLDYIISY